MKGVGVGGGGVEEGSPGGEAFCVGDPRELGNEKRRGYTANSLLGIYP